jgi:dipeptidyl aminopeptidase/acylaminoacyl peptidase
LLGFSLGGCRATILASGTRPSAEIGADGRIPAAAFFRRPLISHVALSPDGQHIAGVTSRDGRETVMVREAAGGKPRALAKLDRRSGLESWTIRRLGWASDDDILTAIEMPNPNVEVVQARMSRLMVLPREGSRPRYLGARWPYDEYVQMQDDVVSWLPEDPDHVLLNLQLRGDRGKGVRLVNVSKGTFVSLVPAHEGISSWAADHRGDVRAGWGVEAESTDAVLSGRVGADDAFDEIARFDPFEEPGLAFAGFGERPETLYVYGGETGRRAVYSYDLAARKLGPLVFEHPDVDVDELYSSSVDGRLLAIGYATDRPFLHFVDAAAERIQTGVDAALPGRTNRFVSSSRDEALSIVESSGDVHPPTYYLFDREQKEMSFLFDAYPELKNATLAEMKPITYTARDGLVIRGYLTLPPGAGALALPAIVFPHGGPWTRDVWGWDPVVQFLASRGFAVLQPNFRGSDGYGLEFRNRGFGTWGEEMQDDITDGARWLVEQGVADPERIGIYGTSYGGFAALQALITAPDVFHAGASFAGVTDVPALLEDDTAYVGLGEEMEKLVGDRRHDRDRLEQISPVRQAAKIRRPVLIGHGTEDWRVHVSQAYDMIDALEAAGVPSESYIYEGAGHGFIDERNQIDFYEKLAAFFARTLRSPGSSGTPATP